jgi:hypothetical protein
MIESKRGQRVMYKGGYGLVDKGMTTMGTGRTRMVWVKQRRVYWVYVCMFKASGEGLQ